MLPFLRESLSSLRDRLPDALIPVYPEDVGGDGYLYPGELRLHCFDLDHDIFPTDSPVSRLVIFRERLVPSRHHPKYLTLLEDLTVTRIDYLFPCPAVAGRSRKFQTRFLESIVSNNDTACAAAHEVSKRLALLENRTIAQAYALQPIGIGLWGRVKPIIHFSYRHIQSTFSDTYIEQARTLIEPVGDIVVDFTVPLFDDQDPS